MTESNSSKRNVIFIQRTVDYKDDLEKEFQV